MVCNRCILVVKEIIEKHGLKPDSIELGEAVIIQELSDNQLKSLSLELEKFGFELIDDQKGKIIEKIKNTIIQLVHHSDEELKENISAYLAEKLNKDYTYLSNLFSEVQGTTIEKYYIAQKIEKVKELLVYNELTLSEIAHKMGYSSVAYLSNQFKKVTGLTPSHFKAIKEHKRNPLDSI